MQRVNDEDRVDVNAHVQEGSSCCFAIDVLREKSQERDNVEHKNDDQQSQEEFQFQMIALKRWEEFK